MSFVPAPRARQYVRRATTVACLLAVAVTVVGLVRVVADEYKSGIPWSEPKMVDPGAPGGVPSDAVVLFDGKSMGEWHGGDRWIVKDAAATASSIVTSPALRVMAEYLLRARRGSVQIAQRQPAMGHAKSGMCEVGMQPAAER